MAKKETASQTAPLLPMLKTVEQMSKVSGIGENKLRELMDSGELEYIQNGNRRLIADAAIWDWYHRTNGKQSDFPDVALVPYPVIVAATKGDPDAMKIVLQHFSGYIASLSMRKLCDERGNVYFGVDEDIRQRLQARLMRAILTFRVE